MPIQLPHRTSVRSSLHSKERYPYLVPYRKYMHLINSRYTYFTKMTSVKTFGGLSRVDSFRQDKCYHSESFDELNQRENQICFSFLKYQFFLGWKKTLVISEWIHLSVVFQWIMLRVLYMDVLGGWGTFGPVGTGNLFLHAGNQGPNRHVIGQDDQYWTLHAELGDKSSHNNNNNI